MTRRHRPFALVVAGLGLLHVFLPGGLRAQDDPQVMAEARRLFEEGVSALDQSRFADAADLLERSLELRESPPARYNRALALRGAGRYREAVAEAERYLEVATGPRHREDRQLAEELLAELRASLATLHVHVVGGAERVTVDGEEVATADGDLDLVRDPGLVRVVATRAGHNPARQEVELVAGGEASVSLDASAEPLPATLSIEVAPRSASIRLDDALLGIGRVQVQADPGEHHLLLDADGYVPESREVTLPPGDTLRLSISLPAVPETPLTRRWWFWTLVGGGVAAVGAAIAVAVVVANDVPPIETGSLGFAQEVLRSP